MRLIDADKLQERAYQMRFDTIITEGGLALINYLLSKEPTVDLVKHGQWISCEERMPEEPFGCLVTVMDTEPMTCAEFENILPYFVGWDGEQWNDGDGERCPFEVLAWMPLPEPYMLDEVR